MPKWYTAWFSSPIPGTACCALSPLGKLLHLTGPRSSTTGPCRDCCSTTACEKSGDILPLTVVNTRPYPQQPPESFQSGVSFVQEFTYQVVTGKMCQGNSTYLCQDEEDMAETGIKKRNPLPRSGFVCCLARTTNRTLRVDRSVTPDTRRAGIFHALDISPTTPIVAMCLAERGVLLALGSRPVLGFHHS